MDAASRTSTRILEPCRSMSRWTQSETTWYSSRRSSGRASAASRWRRRSPIPISENASSASRGPGGPRPHTKTTIDMTLETATRPVQSTPPAEPAAPPDAAPADALPQRRSHVRGLRCRACGRPEALGPSFICPACFGPLEVEYDHDIARSTLTRDAIARRAPGIWRYLELLPVERAPERGLAVGSTALVRAERLAGELGLGAGTTLHLKDDTRNPTLS